MLIAPTIANVLLNVNLRRCHISVIRKHVFRIVAVCDFAAEVCYMCIKIKYSETFIIYVEMVNTILFSQAHVLLLN